MSLVGIELAARAHNTAVCVLESGNDGRLRVSRVFDGVSDVQLFELMTVPTVTRIGIAAPFGWPTGFYEAISRYRDTGEWPDELGDDLHQNHMRWRKTDAFMWAHAGLAPGSVSTDRLAVVAMRCARLLSALWKCRGETPDRSGAGIVVEVHPAAALELWDLSQQDHPQDPGSYKGSSAGAARRRERLMRAVAAEGNGWLELTPKDVELCIGSDRLLDALICALVARAAEMGRVVPVESPEAAAVEGWIALPDSPLAGLGGALSAVTEDDGVAQEHFMPNAGYLGIYLPERFALEIQDHVGGPWYQWAGGLERNWFIRDQEGTYVCTSHGGSPIYFRAISIDAAGVFEHVDGGGHGKVYRYRLRPEAPLDLGF